jgi:hypothetical protein
VGVADPSQNLATELQKGVIQTSRLLLLISLVKGYPDSVGRLATS